MIKKIVISSCAYRDSFIFKVREDLGDDFAQYIQICKDILSFTEAVSLVDH